MRRLGESATREKTTSWRGRLDGYTVEGGQIERLERAATETARDGETGEGD